MSHKRLEAAIEAGKAIDRGDSRLAPHTPTPLPQLSGDERVALSTCISVDYDEAKDGVYAVRYTNDGEFIAVAYGDGSVELLSPTQGILERSIKSRYMGSLPVTSLRFHPHTPTVLLASCCDGYVYMCKTSSGGESCERVIKEADNEINALDYLADGNKVVTVGKDSAVRLYDSNTLQCTQTYSSFSYNIPDSLDGGHVQRVFAVRAHHTDKDVFITGGWDNLVKIWDYRTTEGVQRTIHGPHLCGDSIDIQDGMIVTGSWVAAPDALQLWDYGTGRLITHLPFPTAGLPAATPRDSTKGNSTARSRTSDTFITDKSSMSKSTTSHPTSSSPHDDSSNDGDVGGPSQPLGRGGPFLYCAQFCGPDTVLAGGSGTCSVRALHVNTLQTLGELHLHHPVQALHTHGEGRSVCVGGMGNQLKITAM